MGERLRIFRSEGQGVKQLGVVSLYENDLPHRAVTATFYGRRGANAPFVGIHNDIPYRGSVAMADCNVFEAYSGDALPCSFDGEFVHQFPKSEKKQIRRLVKELERCAEIERTRIAEQKTNEISF